MNQDTALYIPAPPRLTADTALFLDFDGTLVDIAMTPEDIRVADRLGLLLQEVAEGLNGALAVVSGRPIDVIDKHLGHMVRAVAGIHGAVRRTQTGDVEPSSINPGILNASRRKLEMFAQNHHGVLLEDKGVSIALHFRNVPNVGPECLRMVEDCAAASDGNLVCLSGKMVAELKPAQTTKADAINAYMNEKPFVGRRPVFAGDDVTDEAGFRAVQKMDGYGVIVGDRTPTAASTRLASVADLHEWLKTFCTEVVQ